MKENFELYKNNLLKLEEEIYNKGSEYLIDNKSNHIISRYSRKEQYEKIYNDFLEKFNKNIAAKYKNKYMLLPFGSITEFLSTDNSDIDLYLYIEELNKDEQKEFLLHIINNCKLFCQKVEEVVSLRLFLIELEFEGIDIDLSVIAFSPYIHSLLFREYSLIDARFPLIAIALKDFVKITDLGKKAALNNFSWITLLILFLQDIIKPPVLPKLYSDKEINEIFYKTVEFGNNFRFSKQKIFFQFYKNRVKEKVPIPDCLFKKEKILKIYENFKKNNYREYGCEKNVLTCSELFFKFLEFLMLLKFDSIYANCSIEKEGFFNMSEIKLIDFNENELERQKHNISYYNYFKKKYINFGARFDIKRKRDGLILIRDPVDPHYNPGQSFREEENFQQFIKRMKYGYTNLLKYGSFKKLNEKFKAKELKKQIENKIDNMGK